MTINSLDRVFSKAFSFYKPPEPLTVSQWAEKYRVLSRGSSAEVGMWNNNRTPYMVEPMDAFDDPKVHDITIVAMSQVGKSETELNIIGKIIHQDPGNILYVHPNIEEAKKFSTARIAPMVRDCRVLRSRVADVKSRDSRNTLQQKTYPGGMLNMVGSQSAAALAGMPVRYVIGDEIDRWAKSAGTEGDPWKLACKRTTTFYNAKRVAVSTPTVKGDSRIADLFDDGTQEYWCSQCPDCGEWHNLIFDDIKFEYEVEKKGKTKNYKIKSIHWCCPSCGCIHTEETMRKQPAKWIATNPDAYEQGRRSFWLNAFASPWRSWEAIVREFLESKDDPQKFQVFYNTTLGQLWEERGDLDDEETFLARREDYGTREDGAPIELPDGVLVLTCGVDTQDDRLEYEVVGWGHYLENWGIKRGVIPGDPNDDETWERLTEAIVRNYMFADGTKLKLSKVFVDSGGHKTQSVYKHCRARRNHQFFAVKGKGGKDIPFTKPASKVDIVVNGKAIAQTWLYTIGTDAGKADILKGMLRVVEPGAKYCHFPKRLEAGYDLYYFTGLLSEHEVTVREKGKIKTMWKVLPGHERNEPLDCRNYAYAALRVLDPNMDEVERKIRNIRENKQAQPKPTAQQRKRRTTKKQNHNMDDW